MEQVPPGFVGLSVRLPAELKSAIRQMAKDEHRNVSGMIKHLILEEVKRRKNFKQGIYSWEDLIKHGFDAEPISGTEVGE